MTHEFDPSNEDIKKAMKEAMKEWLNEQYAVFGRWTLHGLLAAALIGMVYLALFKVFGLKLL